MTADPDDDREADDGREEWAQQDDPPREPLDEEDGGAAPAGDGPAEDPGDAGPVDEMSDAGPVEDSGDAAPSDDMGDAGPVDGLTGAERGPGVPENGAGTDGDEAPLGDLADRVNRRRERARESEADDLFDRAFEEAGAADADGEALWEDLETESLGGTVEEPAAEADEDVYVVAKREYCQRCQYFSAPPKVQCTYEGSTILALEDTDHFRVTGCPIVEGEESLRDR